jgi:hypothetical protein
MASSAERIRRSKLHQSATGVVAAYCLSLLHTHKGGGHGLVRSARAGDLLGTLFYPVVSYFLEFDGKSQLIESRRAGEDPKIPLKSRRSSQDSRTIIGNAGADDRTALLIHRKRRTRSVLRMDVYSDRRSSIGSAAQALCAGMRQSTTPQRMSTLATPPNVLPSHGYV